MQSKLSLVLIAFLLTECEKFLAGMAGTIGGEATNGSTSYIAPVKKEMLYKNCVYEYDYYLIIGTLSEIRNRIYKLHSQQLQQTH